MKKLVAFYILVFVPSIIHSQLSTQLLLQTLQQNPSLLLSNPELLRRVISATQQPQPQPQLVPQPRRDECSAIKKQNKLLRQMLSSVTGPGVLNDLDFNESIKSQQVVNPVQALLNQVQQAPEPPQPSISLTSSLVTPPATWTTSMTTTSYVTTVTHTETQEVPIILRGQKLVTTIYESHTQVVTATEIKTSSIHLTPSPTWEVQTVTITPTATAPAPLLLNSATLPQPLVLPQLPSPIKKKRNNRLEAQVVEINRSSGVNKDDVRSAYGAYFASSAQRSADRFGDILRPVRNPHPNLFSSQPEDYDYYEDFDQQFLAAQNKPVYVQSPQQSSKVFTLYFSGTKPGEFTTKMTRLAVDDNGQPILSRNKRDQDSIRPSKVMPIENTLPPSFFNELDSSDDSLIITNDDLDSSMTVVTVTQTVTVTDPIVACSV